MLRKFVAWFFNSSRRQWRKVLMEKSPKAESRVYKSFIESLRVADNKKIDFAKYSQHSSCSLFEFPFLEPASKSWSRAERMGRGSEGKQVEIANKLRTLEGSLRDVLLRLSTCLKGVQLIYRFVRTEKCHFDETRSDSHECICIFYAFSEKQLNLNKKSNFCNLWTSVKN